MNPLLSSLQPYPFERLRRLTRGTVPNPALRPISLAIGEPKHPTPVFIQAALAAALDGLAVYPATVGEPALRAACAGWLQRRYAVAVDAATQLLPVNGSREALFALAQTVIDPTRPNATVVCPNPFYQIYEGAALLAGARCVQASGDAQAERRGEFATDWSAIDDATWAATQLLYVCSPGNPTGAVLSLADWERLFDLSDRHGFVIAADECYSEIYFGAPPLGSLQAAAALGRGDFRRLVAFTSLSKRSNVPGLRSGFVAGDAALIEAFLLYRTYHGSAMGPAVQRASIAAWGDEAHVEANRVLYREKFARVVPILAQVMDVAAPDAGFYLWPRLRSSPGDAADAAVDDAAFARTLLAQYNLAVVPGSYLARDVRGINPGAGRIRLALVASVDDCVEAAERLVSFVRSTQSTQPTPSNSLPA